MAEKENSLKPGHLIEKSKKEMKQELLKIIENYEGDNKNV